MEISHIKYNHIDRQKWSRCIDNCPHGSLYATPVYLDALARKWDALIYGDYEFIMPLISKSKAGIKYLYQPAFLPQTGIFGATGVDEEIISAFLQKAFSLFAFAEISLVYPLRVKTLNPQLSIKERDNFVLDLRSDHATLNNNYAPAFTKSLRRLQKLNLQYQTGDALREVTELFQRLYSKKLTGVGSSDVEHFLTAGEKLQSGHNVFIRKACTPASGILSAVILLRYKNRLYNMMSCITDEGKKAEANYFLYDKIIEEFSGKGMVLDLEGSDIKGIADFYRKMNPVNESYRFIRYNDLPWPVNILKGKH